MRNARSIWLLTLLIPASACGDDAVDEGPTVRELPALYAASACPEFEACLPPIYVDVFFGPQGCEEFVSAQGEDSDFPALQAAIDDGRVEYDSSKVGPCLDSIAGAGCGLATSRTFARETCEGVFTGTVAIGEPCNVDEECEGVAFCQRSTGCPGACSELLGPGEPCTEDDHCEDGLSCSGDTDTCAAPGEAGDPCQGDTGTECGLGLSCFGDDEMTGAAGMCLDNDEVFVLDEGEACDLTTGMLCKSGLSCIVETIDPLAFVCAEVVASGEACTAGGPSQCPVDERCDANVDLGIIEGNCVPLPRVGEACVVMDGRPTCAPGLICDVDGQCHARARLGQSCESGDGCASKTCVDNVCERPEVCEL